MHARSPWPGLVVALGVATVAGAGCGSSGGRPMTAARAGPHHGATGLAIDEPAARRVALTGQQLRGALPVSGQAAPGGSVALSSGCGAARCRAVARADGSGRWRALLEVQAPLSRPYARITAREAGDSALALAQLRPDHVPAAPAPRIPAAPPPPQPRPGRARTGAFVIIGDSLAVGTAPLLPGDLPGWTVISDGRKSRTLAAGMARIGPAGRTPTVLAFSLFTNDDPRALGPLAVAVRRSVALQRGHGCAVWATIVRPPVAGVTYAGANALLIRLGGQHPDALRIVPWASEVARHPSWLGPDRVHATPTGYAARAQMYAAAAKTCTSH